MLRPYSSPTSYEVYSKLRLQEFPHLGDIKGVLTTLLHPKSFVYDTRHQARLGVVVFSALNKRQMSGLNVSVFAVVVHPTARNHVSESHNKDGMVVVEEDIKDSDEELQQAAQAYLRVTQYMTVIVLKEIEPRLVLNPLRRQ